MLASTRYAALGALLLISITSLAQQPASSAAMAAATAMVNRSMIHGPQRVSLSDGASLSLPQDMCYVPKAATGAYFGAIGQPFRRHADGGMVVPCADFARANWFVLLTIDHGGYIGDRRQWTADGILATLGNVVARGNPGRKKAGLPELRVDGWAEEPRYDALTHRLSWGARVQTVCPDACSRMTVISYEMVILSRDGYLDLTMMSSPSTFSTDKRIADRVLESISYTAGRRYTDFDAKTDKVAAFDLVDLMTANTMTASNDIPK